MEGIIIRNPLGLNVALKKEFTVQNTIYLGSDH